MSTDADTVATFVTKARIAETLQVYAFSCDEKDRDGLLTVFTDDAEATYDGTTWLTGRTTIVDWLLGALGGLSYSQHMITAPRIDVHGETAGAVGYLNAHQRAAADPGRMMRMNARYDCDLRRVDQVWQISRLVLSVGWSDTASSS